MRARASASAAQRSSGRRPLPLRLRRRPAIAVVAAAAPPAPPPPPPLPPDPPSFFNSPYGEYAWVRRAARSSNDLSRLLPYLSAENAFAASQAGAGTDADADALSSELGEWALSAAVGGLEVESGDSVTTTTYPDAPPLASATNNASNNNSGERAPLRGKRARRALKPRLGPGCARVVFGDDEHKGLLLSVRDAELSPCGRFLALLLLISGAQALRIVVLCAESGATLAEAAAPSSCRPLDVPLAWGSPGWGYDGDDQHLFFLASTGAGGELAVQGLRVGAGSAVGASSFALPPGRTRHWARAALVRHGNGPLFVVGWAPDGGPAGSYLVIPAGVLSAEGEEEDADDADADGGNGRLALSLWSGGGDDKRSPLWAVARRWGVGEEAKAELFLGKASPRAPHWQPWVPVALPPPRGVEEGERLEAVFLPPPPPPPKADAASSRADPPPPYLITLSTKPLPESAGLSLELVARRFDLSLDGDGAAAAAALRAEATAGPVALTTPPSSPSRPVDTPPFLDPRAWQPAGADAWTLSNVVWDAAKQEVRADASAMGCPPRRLALSLAVVASAPSNRSAKVVATTAAPGWWAEASLRSWPRLWRTAAPTADGARVPVTVLLPLARASPSSSSSSSPSAPFPLLLTAYGAYGAREPEGLSFDPKHEALCRRGWAVAVAHVRGGAGAGGAGLPPSRQGRGGGGNGGGGGGGGDNDNWRSAGRSAERKHLGIEDVLSAARHLVAQGVADPRRLCLSAQSAGAWVAVPAAAAAAVDEDAETFRALLLTVPALCPSDEARAQTMDKEAEEEEAQQGPFSAATSDASELGGGATALEQSQHHRQWDPYACCCARLARSDSSRILLRTALDDRVVGFWEALCFAARLRRLREEEEGAGGSEASSSSVLLRTVPRGGHAAFAGGDGMDGEDVLALMFLLGSVAV